jgi:hypothetical protein
MLPIYMLKIIENVESLGIWNWEQWVLHKRLHIKEKQLAYFGGQFVVQFTQTEKSDRKISQL